MCEDCKSGTRWSRRSLLGGGMALAAAGLLPVRAWAQEDVVSPDTALQRLIEGNKRYLAGSSVVQDYAVGRAARALSQSPIAAIVSCSDSRVAPELVFDQGPGSLFVVRVAGNVVNEDGLASLEYAVHSLHTPLIMVLGHSGCGTVDAAMKVVRDKVELPGHLPGLADQIAPAVEAAHADGDDTLAGAVRANVRLGVSRLAAAAPVLADYAANGRIKLVGAHYELSTGEVTLV